MSPDKRYLAAGTDDKAVKLYDIANNQCIHRFDGHVLDIYSLDYARSGRLIVSGSGDKQARLWDVAARKVGEGNGGGREGRRC